MPQGSLSPYTIGLWLLYLRLYLFAVSFTQWQVPLQLTGHHFCYFAVGGDGLAEGSFTCAPMRMEGWEAPDWGSPSQGNCSQLPLCLPLPQVLRVCLLHQVRAELVLVC